MALPRIQKCFGLKLKICCVLLGVVNVIFTLFVLFYLVNVAFLIYQTHFHRGSVAMTFFIICLIINFILLAKLLFDIYFIYAVVSERPNVVYNYKFMWEAFLLLGLIIIMCNMPPSSLFVAGTYISYLCFNIYAVVICQCYYKKLKTRNEECV